MAKQPIGMRTAGERRALSATGNLAQSRRLRNVSLPNPLLKIAMKSMGVKKSRIIKSLM